jgi:hypothetical protein
MSQPTPPGWKGYVDTSGKLAIEASTSLVMLSDVNYAPPPPGVVPLRNFRTVTGDYRIYRGVPVAPPICDSAVPILVSVDPDGVSLPDLSRALPDDIDTLATLRWIAADAYVSYDANGETMFWTDTEGQVAWSSYDTWQPLLDEDYSYRLEVSLNSTEILSRSALVFDAILGSCMSTQLSLNPMTLAENVEFVLVFRPHSFNSTTRYSSYLDNGDPIQGYHDMPFEVGDSLYGQRQGFSRHTDPDRMVLIQDKERYQLNWTSKVSSSSGPIIARLRFGTEPLIEIWGDKDTHSRYSIPDVPAEALATNFVLGRRFGSLSQETNGGMHLFEVNYYDHMVERAEMNAIAEALDTVYAVSSG